MELAGAEHALFDGGVFDRIEADGVELYAGGVPVTRILGDDEDGVGLPLGEGEGAVGDQVAGLGPFAATLGAAAELVEARLVERAEMGGGEDREKVGRAKRKGEDERAGIGGFDADGGEILAAAFEVIARADEGEDDVGALTAELGLEETAEGGEKIIGGDGVAVGPAGVGAEVEGPREAVGGDGPAATPGMGWQSTASMAVRPSITASRISTSAG